MVNPGGIVNTSVGFVVLFCFVVRLAVDCPATRMPDGLREHRSFTMELSRKEQRRENVTHPMER
jgi:hypothetical protein